MDYPLTGPSGARLRLLTLALFALFTMAPFATAYFGSLYSVWYRVLALVLLSLYFYLRRLRDGWEVRLLTLWCLWLTLVQMLHGDLSLLDSWEHLFNMWTQILWLVVPMLLQQKDRLRLLDGIALIFGLAFSLLAALCLYGALTGVKPLNPFSGEALYYFSHEPRLYALGQNTNTVAHWFFLDFWMMIWLFLRSRRAPFRLLAVLGAVLAWLGIALTVSRNSMLGFSVCAGLGLGIVLLRKLPLRRRSLQTLVLLAVLCVSVPLLWKSFTWATGCLVDIQKTVAAEPVAAEPSAAASPAAAARPEKKTENVYEQGRGLEDSGRLPIYRAALQVLGENPLRLLTGETDVMGATNARLRQWRAAEGKQAKEFAHHHCSYLHVLMGTGLPGFLLLAGFLLLLLEKMGRLLHPAMSGEPALCAVVLCLLGIGLYNLLETCLLYASDIRCILFFLLAGTVIACARDMAPVCRQSIPAGRMQELLRRDRHK